MIDDTYSMLKRVTLPSLASAARRSPVSTSCHSHGPIGVHVFGLPDGPVHIDTLMVPSSLVTTLAGPSRLRMPITLFCGRRLLL